MEAIKELLKPESFFKSLVGNSKDVNLSFPLDSTMSWSLHNSDHEFCLENFFQLSSKISQLHFSQPQNGSFKSIAVTHSISSGELKSSKIIEELKKVSEMRSLSFPNLKMVNRDNNEDVIQCVDKEVKFSCNIPECDTNQNKNNDTSSESEIWDEWDDDDDDGYIGISDTLKFSSCPVVQMTATEIFETNPKNTLTDLSNRCSFSPDTTCDLNWSSGIEEEIERLPKGSPTDTDDILIYMHFSDEEEQLKQKITEANCHWNNHYSSPLPIQPKPCKVQFKESPTLHSYDDEGIDRKGPWETMARDVCRFKRHIETLEKILSPILQPEHRSKMWDLISSKQSE